MTNPATNRRPAGFNLDLAILASLLVLAAALYLAILLTSQSHVDGDEAVVGIMARHVLYRGDHPVFFYGQAYGGGGAIEAYLGALAFIVLGPTSVALKSVAMLLALATVAATYRFCLNHLGRATAILAAAIMAFSTPLVEWHFKMRGGYALLLLLTVLILMQFAALAYGRRAAAIRFLALGFLAGLAYYNLELIVPTLAALALFSLVWKQVFWRPRPLLLLAAGFLVGLLPLILVNLATGFENLRLVASMAGGNVFQRAGANFLPLISRYLPAFFMTHNVDGVQPPTPAAWLQYLAFAALLIFAAIICWRDLARSVRGIFRLRLRLDGRAPGILAVLIVVVIVHLAFALISRGTGESPRYFLGAFPALVIVAAAGIARILWTKQWAWRIAAIALATTILAPGVYDHLRAIAPAQVNDDVLTYQATMRNVPTAGDTVPRIIAYLKPRGITAFRSTYFLQWRLMFESGETLIGSSHGLWPRAYRYPPYDEQVNNAGRIALILHRDDPQLQRFLHSDLPKQFDEPASIGEYVIFTGPQPEIFRDRQNYTNPRYYLPFR